MRVLICCVLIATAFAGFCENKPVNGWYCDGSTAKYCEDRDKDREQYCGFRCVQSLGCVQPCQLKKAAVPLSYCAGIVSYQVDDVVNVASEDQQAQTQAASYPVADGTAQGIDCAATYKNFACRYQLVNCDDRTRAQCFFECNRTNICRKLGEDTATPLECVKMCVGATLGPVLWLVAITTIAAVVFVL